MGLNDDLRELGELAEMVNDDGAPLPEFQATFATQPVAVVGEEPAPAPVEAPAPSGGDEPAELDLDALLGLSKPVAAPEPERGSGTPAPETSEPPAGSADARIKELTDRLRKSEEEREALFRRALGDQTAPDQPPTDAPVLDEATREFLKPYIQAEVDKVVAEKVAPMEQELAPMRQQQQDAALAQALSKTVAPGFTPEHVKVLHDAYNATTDEDMKAIYGNGLAGATALAQSLINRGVLDLAGSKPKPRVNPLVARHNSPSGGPAGGMDDGRDEDARVRAILNADNDAWLAALRKQGID
jgi:hypothetical protein